MDNILLEPLKAYESVYKTQIVDEATKYFDNLVEKAQTDIAANKDTVNKIKKEKSNEEKASKSLASLKIGRGFTIFGLVVGILAFIVGLMLIILQVQLEIFIPILIMVGGVLLTAGMIVLLVKVLNPRIKRQSEVLEKIQKKIRELVAIAECQMASLNSLFDWNMPNEVITKMIPLLQLDKFLDGSKYHGLIQNYGFGDLLDPNYSAIYAQSGSILGNPFIIQDQKAHRIIDKVYHGSLLISWTEYYTDSNGRTQSRRRTQTLHATSVHPAPDYYREVKLIYGNTAAPDLSFSRSPSGMSGKSDKEIQKHVESKSKDLDKLEEKSLMNSSSGGHVFTALNNNTFEVLFGATNRDHEQQFRLLFTPLAQTNMTKLIRTSEPYGDDFYFYKNKMVNIISSKHSQSMDYSGSPAYFITYDYELSKSRFISFTSEYFKSLFFDFAPLLSVPLYQQTKTLEYIYGDDAPTSFSPYEHEIFANSFDESNFKHPKSITQAMLKTRIISKGNQSDIVEVKAYSYEGIDHIDFVPVLGGDGHMHNVPVPWVEYVPLENVSHMSLKNTNKTRNEFLNNLSNNKGISEFIQQNSKGSNYSYQRGLLALLVNEYYNQSSEQELDSILNKED